MLIFEHLQQGMYLAVIFSALPLFSSLFIGLILSVLQAATQIQENTLTFVPKLIVVSLALYFMAPFITTEIVDFTVKIANSIAFF